MYAEDVFFQILNVSMLIQVTLSTAYITKINAKNKYRSPAMGEWEATPKISYVLSAAFAFFLASLVINLSSLKSS